MIPRRRFATSLALFLVLCPNLGAEEQKGNVGAKFSLTKTEVGHELKTPDGRTVLQYMTEKPRDSQLTANSTCCFYPVFTPKGTRVVDFAPDDHPHHRGIFLAWHNIQGNPGGDFWGWGEYAPTAGRIIRNKSVVLDAADEKSALIQVANSWMAQDCVVLEEALTIDVHEREGAYQIGLDFLLTPQRDLTLGQTAFSGFNVKSRKAKSAYRDAGGEVNLPDPHYLKPETDWPSRPWYDYTFTLEDGTVAGVTVIDHAENPPTTWHNLKPIAMINPCIVAPGEVVLPAKKPLRLRYRLVVHDGPLPAKAVTHAARDFGRK